MGETSLSDDELLDFDEMAIASYDASAARQSLERFGDAFRFQLVAARHLERRADRLERDRLLDGDESYLRGHVKALREVAANLRKGNYLPGGPLHEQTYYPRRSH
jgi:hypothetical protein